METGLNPEATGITECMSVCAHYLLLQLPGKKRNGVDEYLHLFGMIRQQRRAQVCVLVFFFILHFPEAVHTCCRQMCLNFCGVSHRQGVANVFARKADYKWEDWKRAGL